MTLNKVIITAVVTSLVTAPVMAGSAAAAPTDPVPQYNAPVSGDWTGGYVGLNLGYGKTEMNGSSDKEPFYGLSAGYDYDMGNIVVGGGLEFDKMDSKLGAETVESAARVKLRAGYDLGNGLAYGTAGAVRFDTKTAGTDTGYFVGAGYEHKMTDQISVGTEVIYNKVKTFKGGSDLKGTTISAKVNYRF